MKKSVYIADSYSLNTGDIGILIATIAALRSRFKNVTIYVESSHPEALAQYDLECAGVFPRILDISQIVGGQASKPALAKAWLLGLYDSAAFLLFALAARLKLPAVWLVRPSRREQAKAIQAATLWLSSGGGFLSSYYRPEFRFYGYLLALILRKPYVIFAQSVGPFFGKIHAALARFFLNRAGAITIREDDSYRYMQAFGLGKPLRLTADIAFLLPVIGPDNKVNKSKKAAAICVKKGNEKYAQAMQHAALLLVKQGYRVHFVSQTPNDDALAEQLQKKAGKNTTYTPFGLDPRAVKGLYGQCELIIATRMHALIFAVGQGVPWIGIGYEPKFRGLSKQLGETGILIEEKDLTAASLDQRLQELARRPKPKKHPAKELTAKARENIEVLAKILELE